jgi:hypothetical protein
MRNEIYFEGELIEVIDDGIEDEIPDDEVTITLSAIQQAKEKLEDSSTNSIAKIKTVLLEFFEGIGE